MAKDLHRKPVTEENSIVSAMSNHFSELEFDLGPCPRNVKQRNTSKVPEVISREVIALRGG